MVRPHTATNSERSRFAQCQHKWLLSSGLGLDLVSSTMPLVFGSAWHAFQETWWKEWGDAALTDRSGLDTIHSRCDALADQTTGGFSSSGGVGWTEHQVEESRELLLDMASRYQSTYADQQDYGQAVRLVQNETPLKARTRTPAGTPTNFGLFAGTPDKVVEDRYGQCWIVEHKTTSYSLDRWPDLHGYSPQVLSYAWLLREAGIRVVGVIYDLALKAMAPTVDRFQVVKSGGRLSKRLPANATAAGLRQALAHHRLEADAWTREKLEALDRAPDPFFRRYTVRFTEGEIHRTGMELWSVAAQLRRAHATRGTDGLSAREAREAIRHQWLHHSPTRGMDRAHTAIWSLGHLFPRNGSACYSWGSPCRHMDLCQHQSRSTLASYQPARRRYAGFAKGI